MAKDKVIQIRVSVEDLKLAARIGKERVWTRSAVFREGLKCLAQTKKRK